MAEHNHDKAKLEVFLDGMKKMQKDLEKVSTGLNANLGRDFEKIIHEYTYEGEKRTKVNKKPALMSLAKDGSIKLVFDNPEDGQKFFKGEK